MSKEGAAESRQVQKARRKLEEQLIEERKKVTPETLAKMVKEIQHYIQRHVGDRETLKAKEITLFDENRHAAKVLNPYILALRTQIEAGKISAATARPLRGRVKCKK